MAASLYIDAGTDAPEFRWPTTATTLPSTSFRNLGGPARIGGAVLRVGREGDVPLTGCEAFA